jgi:hypothetical protein
MHQETRNEHKILIGISEGREYSKDLGVDVKIILELILGKYGGRVCTGFIWLRIETNWGFL